MKINMAEEDYFNIGSIIACTTCFGQKIEGEVVAFDNTTKMVALKLPPSSAKKGLNDVKFVNLAYVRELTLVDDASSQPTTLSNLNLNKLAGRLKQNLDEKKRQVDYIGVDVSPEAQFVFNSITKTIKEVRWEGKNIIVMDQVTITPPYAKDNCHIREGSPGNTQKALEHVTKIVEKHYRESEK